MLYRLESNYSSNCTSPHAIILWISHNEHIPLTQREQRAPRSGSGCRLPVRSPRSPRRLALRRRGWQEAGRQGQGVRVPPMPGARMSSEPQTPDGIGPVHGGRRSWRIRKVSRCHWTTAPRPRFGRASRASSADCGREGRRRHATAT